MSPEREFNVELLSAAVMLRTGRGAPRGEIRRIAGQVFDEHLGEPMTPQTAFTILARIAQLAQQAGYFPQESYEQGYGDGGSSAHADWNFAMTAFCELPEDVDGWSPTEVAKYIGRLQARIVNLEETL